MPRDTERHIEEARVAEGGPRDFAKDLAMANFQAESHSPFTPSWGDVLNMFDAIYCVFMRPVKSCERLANHFAANRHSIHDP